PEESVPFAEDERKVQVVPVGGVHRGSEDSDQQLVLVPERRERDVSELEDLRGAVAFEDPRLHGLRRAGGRSRHLLPRSGSWGQYSSSWGKAGRSCPLDEAIIPLKF